MAVRAPRLVVEARLAGEARCSTAHRPTFWVGVTALFFFAAVVFVEPASACVCSFDAPDLEETFAVSDTAILAMVVGQGDRFGRAHNPGSDAAWLDVEVLDSIKGAKVGSTARIWVTPG